MKRVIISLAFCFSLLLLLSFVLFPPVEAKEDVLMKLLDLPAPPPPNPLAKYTRIYSGANYNKRTPPPKDDAPIEELLDYWKHESEAFTKLRYNPAVSDQTCERLMREIEKDPKLLADYLNVFNGDRKGADFVKAIYDREMGNGTFDRDGRASIRHWLTYNSAYYSNDLARLAQQVADTPDYVTNQDELLALARVDFDRASPVINRFYGVPSPKASRILALWALYRHALDTGSASDSEKYRGELKDAVAEKGLPGPTRDLAMDALVSEKEWPGRDEWYISLLADPTLADLGGYTGLTTLMLVSAEDKYTDRMLELVKSDNPTVRGAAVRNLITHLQSGNPEILKALLPWLDDPKWALDTAGSRAALVRTLATIEVPESVPGLIKILDEKASRNEVQQYYGTNANVKPSNTMANAANPVAFAVNSLANRPTNSSAGSYPNHEVTFYPFRSEAVLALKMQKDMQAAPALHRILPEVENYERGNVVSALLACNGFSVPEQLDALDLAAKGGQDVVNPDGFSANSANYVVQNIEGALGQSVNAVQRFSDGPITATEISMLLGQQLLQLTQINDELARSVVDRIESLDAKDPKLAAAYRRMALKWQNSVINALLLRDVKQDKADADTIVRLLSSRKTLREKQLDEVSAVTTGKPAAAGIGACLMENAADYKTILEKGGAETKTALLACARLIRAPLSVAAVAPSLKSDNKLLALAAERYLESEDSPEAAKAILSLHPGEAKILGSTTAFFANDRKGNTNEHLSALFQSVANNDSIYNGWIDDNAEDLRKVEKRLQKEVKQDNDLFGAYAYDSNFVRIYKDKATYTWEEEPSRYRERMLTQFELDSLKSYLTANKVDDLAPFLTCGGEYCVAKELLMLGKNGGRRVYMNGGSPAFFGGLDKYFTELRATPAAIKYALSRELPGLEIVYANDEMHAETVWKDGADLRIVASRQSVRKKVDEYLENAELGDDEPAPADVDPAAMAKRVNKLREKRAFEGFSWHKVETGQLFDVAQPPQVEYIPPIDSQTVQSTQEQWKARTSGFELRASDDGLYKLVGGKLTRLYEGIYSDPVVTPNGRWVVVSKSDAESGEQLVRINLLTGKEYPIDTRDLPSVRAAAFVPSKASVLLVVDAVEGEGHGEESTVEDEDKVKDDPSPDNMMLLDPETGKLRPVSGEFRPISQQTFRPLQPALKPGDYWAAIPDTENNDTRIGILDTKLFRFKQVLRVPQITFNSMTMWVDEPGGKVYFVYRGHLLTLPLNLPPQSAKTGK